MPDYIDLKVRRFDEDLKLPPPGVDPKQADKYLNKLINLIQKDKIFVHHTDLSLFDPSSFQDHYTVKLKDYHIEISHSKDANSGQDFYICLFTNLKYLQANCTEKVILAYTHLTKEQFIHFKEVAQSQKDRVKKFEEEKRFKEVMMPVEKAFDEIENAK